MRLLEAQALEMFMPLVLLGILLVLPILDIYATIRFAESLDVPALLLFVPGFVFGLLLMKRETSTLKVRFVNALQSMSLPGVVFDSGRRMLAAALFLFPGFMSDIFALCLLLIPSRTTPQVATAAAAQSGPKVMDGEFRRLD